MLKWLFYIVLFSAFQVAPALGQDRNLQVAKAGERRLALVIGNGDYKSAPLKNPVNDARAVAKALEATGFKVTALENLSQRQMFEAVRAFGNSLKEDDVAMFYYAGHGMQVKDRNYLIPVEADIQAEDDIPYTSIDVNSVLDRMARARSRFNIVVLDACRNNPFARSFRSAASGLAQMEAPGGTLIAYATAPGKTASDGTGDNGLYTQHLLRHLTTPGLPVEIVFKRVREGVERDTKSAQTPWESSSLKGDFYFKPPEPVAQVASVAPAQQIVPVPGGVDAAARQREQDFAAELAYWDAVKASTSAADYKAYVDQYPQGRFASLARARIASLEQQSAGNQQNREQAFWDSIKSSNNAAEYEAYVAQYPNGQFAALARVRISSLKAQAQQQAQAAAQAAAAAQAQAQAQAQSQVQQQAAAEARENTFWESIRASNNTAEYEAYLAQFPTGRFVALANARIAALRMAASQAAAAAAAPKPAATPAPVAPAAAPVQLVVAAPASVAAPVRAPVGTKNAELLPSPGDAWTYNVKALTPVPGGQVSFRVNDVSADGVAETMTLGGGDNRRSAQVVGVDARLSVRAGFDFATELSPYLQAGMDLKPGTKVGPVVREFPGAGEYQIGPLTIELNGQVDKLEKVTVPAGIFDAVKLVLRASPSFRMGGGLSLRASGDVVVEAWYAPAARRVVRMTSLMRAAAIVFENTTFELASMRLGEPVLAGNPLAAPTPQNRPATQVAVAAPNVATATASQALAGSMAALTPKVGDTWTYRFTDRLSQANNSTLVYTVKSVAPNEIEDVLRVPGKNREPMEASFDAEFSFPMRAGLSFRPPDLAPYLQAFQQISEGKEWKFTADIPWNNRLVQVPFTANFERRERITVPAGTFDAVKVVVEGRKELSQPPGVGIYRHINEIWYAPEVKRFVKVSTIVYWGPRLEDNGTTELTSFKLN